MCSKKKTKCELEGSNTACTQCMRRNTRCKFTTRREKRESLKRYLLSHCPVLYSSKITIAKKIQIAICKGTGRTREKDRVFTQSSRSFR